jgi:hypothetical protein
MKKGIVAVLLLVTVCGTTHGAKNAFKQGDAVGQLGFGLGGLRGLYGTSSLPVISASLDLGIVDKISVGGLIAYTSSSYEYPYLFAGRFYRWRYSYFTLAGRASYHVLDRNEKIDVYAGASLGYNIVSARYDGDPLGRSTAFGSSGSYVHYGVHVGGRYYFMQRFAAFAEVGYGLSFLNVGISMKL